MFRNDRFYFSGVPESVCVEKIGEGYRATINCKNIKFQIANLRGVLEGDIYFFTSKSDVVENLERELTVEGIIGTPDKDNIRSLIALKLK